MLPLQRSGITGRRTRHTGKLAHGRGYLARSPQPSSVPARAPCSPWLALPDPFSAAAGLLAEPLASSCSAPWYSSSPFLTLGPSFGSSDARPRLAVATALLTFSVKLLVPSNHICAIVVLAESSSSNLSGSALVSGAPFCWWLSSSLL